MICGDCETEKAMGKSLFEDLIGFVGYEQNVNSKSLKTAYRKNSWMRITLKHNNNVDFERVSIA